MRKFFASLILSLLMAGVCLASDTVPGDVIVVLRNTSGKSISSLKASGGVKSLSSVQNLASAHEVSIKNTYEALSEQSNLAFMVIHSDTKDERELLREMLARPDVAAASLNHKVHINANERTPNDPQYHQLWGMDAINAPYAWGLSTGSDDIYVVVIDTGIDPNHPDLKDNIAKDYCINFVGQGTVNYDPSDYYDVDDHGSHVAGTIAAVGNNNTGVAGVNWKAKIIAVRVFNENGQGLDSDILAGVNYVTRLLRENPKMNIAAVNMSLGGWNTEYTPWDIMTNNNAYWLAYKTLGDMNRAVMCISAGNESHEVGVPLPEYDSKHNISQGAYVYPASLMNINGMITVAAATQTLERADFSNYGRDFVDIAAPGVAILSTVRTNVSVDAKIEYVSRTYPYGEMEGTSMAAPHVTGAAALLKAIYPDATASEISAAIVGGADGTYLRDDGTSMYGFLDLAGAINFMDASRAANTPPAITNAATHNTVVNQTYLLDLYAAGSKPITWSVDGELPPGLSMDAGEIFGRPTKEGLYSFSVIASNDYGYDSLLLTISVDKGLPALISTDTSIDVYINVPSSFTVAAQGSYPITWGIVSSDFPASFGLKLDGATGYGAFSPDVAGTYHVIVNASNYAGSSTETLNIAVLESVNKPKIVTTEIPDAIRGMTYGISKLENALLAYLNGAPEIIVSADSAMPVSWDVKNLPAGLEFKVKDDYAIRITGAATEIGSFDVVITASNDYGYDSVTYSIDVFDLAPSFLSPKKEFEYQRGVYQFYDIVVIGSAPVSFTVSGDLPSGLEAAIGQSMLKISGVAGNNTSGDYPITIYASNDLGVISKDATIIVADPTAIATNVLPSGVRGKAYEHKMSSLYNVPLSWSILGAGVPGLKMSASGDITGTPTQAGTFRISVKAVSLRNSDVSAMKDYVLTVREIPSITTASLPNGKVGEPYGAEVLSADGTAPITWTYSGNFPAGLVFASNGYIQGTPTVAGTFSFDLTAYNYSGSDTKSFAVTIASASSPTDPTDPTDPATPTDPSKDHTANRVVTVGETRGLSSLTTAQRAQLTANGAMIGAILPEITVSSSDFYTYEDIKAFANVKISSDVPSGYVLLWNPFASDAVNAPIYEAADDSAVFFDTEGKLIETVPANRTINVSAWLDSGKTYAPVITAVRGSDLPGVGASSGGCNSGFAVLGVLGLMLVMIPGMRKENSR